MVSSLSDSLALQLGCGVWLKPPQRAWRSLPGWGWELVREWKEGLLQSRGQVVEKAGLAAPAQTHCPTVLPLSFLVEVCKVVCPVPLEIS